MPAREFMSPSSCKTEKVAWTGIPHGPAATLLQGAALDWLNGLEPPPGFFLAPATSAKP